MSSSLIPWNNNEPFLDWIVWCLKKSGFYDNQQWPDQWLVWEARKHFPKSNLHQKKIMVTVWWSVAHLIHYSFLNPGKTITSENYAQQINEMHQKLQLLQLALVNGKGPILLDSARLYITQPTLQKLNKLGYKVLLSMIFIWPLTNRLLGLQASQQLLAEKCFHNQ